MARGGYRVGAGRPPGVKDSPAAYQSRITKIKQNQILQRLQGLIDGSVEMPPHAVTAALGLLRKIMPDLQSVDLNAKVENTHYTISDQPASEQEWAEQHSAEVDVPTQH